MPSPKLQFASALEKALTERGIKKNESGSVFVESEAGNVQFIHIEYSPSLDSIIYWFNKKSINLYGEALIKTIAYQKKSKGDTEEGISILKDFWKGKAVPVTELNMVDGSGLSPANRVTTKAQVTILQYAQKQPWYQRFYYALPEFNGMKMKSGTIGNVKGFAGYHTSKEGVTYIYSFLVNNYNGSATALVQKMYKVLDHLK
jgi:D-alanyl-D-alanine carboxypeptidase/D-alanyl-D-alanine-endopeptidase (penicillin-binding protein 4)